MKKTCIGILVAVVLLCSLATAQTGKATTGPEQTLKGIETKWAAAYLKSDPTPIMDVVAEDWVGVNAEGKTQTRADLFGEIKRTKLTRSVLSDVRVRMLDGDAAIVSGLWSGAGTDPTGKKFETTTRWTDVFVMKDGKWKCKSTQNTEVQK